MDPSAAMVPTLPRLQSFPCEETWRMRILPVRDPMDVFSPLETYPVQIERDNNVHDRAFKVGMNTGRSRYIDI